MRIDLQVGNAQQFQRQIEQAGGAAAINLGRNLQQRMAAEPRLRMGPYQRLELAQRTMQTAGSEAERRDAALAAIRAQRQIQRGVTWGAEGGGGTFGERLQTFIRTTRFGAAGASPLVGRALDVVGLGRLAGPIGIAAAAIVGLTRAAKAGSDALISFRGAALASGGTGGQVAAAAAAGVPTGEIAGRAAAIRQARASDPFAMMIGARYGLGFTMGRPFGDVNEARDLQQLISTARRLGPGAEQLRLLRAFGQEDLATQINVSPYVRRIQNELGATGANIFGAQQQQGSDVQAGYSNIALATGSLLNRSGLSGAWAYYLNNTARGINMVASWFGGGKQGGDENTKAVKDLTATLKQQNGVLGAGNYGLGPRGEAAMSHIPWRGVLTDRAFLREARLRGMVG